MGGRTKHLQRRFLSLTDHIQNVRMKFQYGAENITVWIGHTEQLTSAKKAKDMSREFNPYAYVPSAPKEWLMLMNKPPPPSYDKEIKAMCLLINRISPQTPLPLQHSPKNTDDGKDDGKQANVPGRMKHQGSDLRSAATSVRSNFRAQSAPSQRHEPRRQATVAFEDDSSEQGLEETSTRPTSATGGSTRPSAQMGRQWSATSGG